MGKVIATCIQKGGCGKTTTCCNVATALAKKGKKVAIVDFDSQGHVGKSFGIKKSELTKTIYDVLIGEASLADIVKYTKFRVDIFPSNSTLANFESILNKNPDVFPRPKHVLRNVLEPVRDKYDLVFIDLPPSLSELTLNGLTAADQVLIPLQCEYLATDGLMELVETIEQVKKRYNPDLSILGAVATMVNPRTNLGSIILQESKKYFDKKQIKMFDTVIHRSVRFAEAPMEGVPAVFYAGNNNVVNDYLKLTEEMFNG